MPLRQPGPGPCNGRALTAELIISEGVGRLRRAIRSDHGSWADVPLAAEGLWPSWSPDGARLIVTWAGTRGKDVRSAVRLLDGDGRAIRDLYVSAADGPAVIAPRVPQYARWSPGGDMVSIVAAAADSLSLYLSDPEGVFTADRIARGAPIFHTWSDDGRFLAIHAGAELLLYRVAERETVLLASEAVGFRAPVFVSGGLAYCIAAADGVTLVWRDLDASESHSLASYPAGAVLQRRGGPGGELAVSVAAGEDMASSLGGMWALDPGGTARPRLIVRGPFNAAAWSPAGDKVALIVPTQIGDGRFAVNVHDADGRFDSATEGFVPSQDMRTFMSFFDQYAGSHPVWSPDGSALVVCGRLPGDGVAWSFADQQRDYVWYWSAHRGSPLEMVGAGDAAFFAPENGNAR